MRHYLFVYFLLSIFYIHIDSTDGLIKGHCTEPDWFLCENQIKCISSIFHCDGENDCNDNSDEINCRNFKIDLSTIRCATDEFQCSDHACIPMNDFCDSKYDCNDKSDEYIGCLKDKKCDDFRCNDGNCVRNETVCNGVSDCSDNSDEEKCAYEKIPASKCNNEFDRYLCKNQRCIFLNATCNEINDCGDESDEDIELCKKADLECKQTAKCEHFCKKTPIGAQCSCRSGYRLQNNGTCPDINECERYDICDQQCINTAGSYSCSCQPGYNLNDDKRTCKAEGGEALMIFSIKSEIHGLYLDSSVYYPVTQNLQHAVAVSIDPNHIYWSDIADGNEAIIRSLEDGSQREVIVTTGLNSPDEIAVDWVTGNIYFTDSGFMHIGVCSNDGSYCTIIIRDRRDKPRGLVLLPKHGLMYWTEWGSNSRILVGGMDGRNNTPLVTENLAWPNSLSIDYANNRLYWVDSKLKLIETVKLDGSDRKIVLHKVVKQPFSLTVFENKLYWSDWSSNTIQSCDKFTGGDAKTLVHTNSTIYGIHIYHSVLKPKIPNPCNSNPCSQLCLLNSENGYTCACTMDKVLNIDKHTCRVTKKKMHLMIAAGNKFIDYYHELLGKPNMTTSVTVNQVTAATYNPLTGGLFASDQLSDKIFHFNVNTGDLKPIMSIENDIVGGMDFDYIGNNLYVSNMKQKSIEVYSLSTNENTVFYFKEEPQDIALIPEEGVMFVVFHEKNNYYIDLIKMNGIGSKIPVEGYKTPLFGPKISLHYDKYLKQLFWSDEGTGRIGITTFDGFETYIFRTGLSAPVSLAVHDDYVFWTQYRSNELFWTSKSTTDQYQKRLTLDISKDLDKMQLISLHATYVKEHQCHKNHGNCSHVCLVSNLHSYICACPPDMMLNVDNRTCIAQTACKPGEIKCAEHDVCIKMNQRCDGSRDCPNGEDESAVCDDPRWSNCEKDDQFRCKSGECISKTKRCNSHYDCVDRSDEEGCEKKECNSNEFQCREGACISKFLVCNKHYDCSDSSDEMNCSEHTCDANSFTCENKKCIPKTWKCDGENDCEDGSDEDETCHRNICAVHMFACHNGRCIDSSLKCNDVDDCEDGTDEQYCTERSRGSFVNCTANEYRCYNTDLCLPKQVRCNGFNDCPKHDDERNCVRCEKGEYVCENQKCIDERWVCDMTDDCGDGSDERDCDGGNPNRINNSGISNCKEFKCSNGVCLPFARVCDGVPDCSDRSDEFGQCAISCMKDNPCENVCHKTPLGPVCGCREGYQLSSDSKTCKDVDECTNSVCAHICHNTDGSFTCSCNEGYVLRSDSISCKANGPHMEFITVTGNDIRRLPPNAKFVEVIYEEVESDITGIDVNAEKETIYWSSDALGIISKMHLKSKKRMVVTGLGRPEALAVDWVTDNVYFIDNDYASRIGVCNLEEQRCAKVVSIGIRKKAISITIDPTKGYLFWSQSSWVTYDNPTTEIYRSGTTGSNVTKIIYLNLGIVHALAIDHMRSKLYWTDTLRKTIESSNFDGSNRAVFLKTDIYQALSMNIYEDNLYWLMGTTRIIKKCKLYADNSCTTISIGNFNIDKYFAILHTLRQPALKNTCESHRCEYMCVLEGNNSACICQNGHPNNSQGVCTLDEDTKVVFGPHVYRKKGESHHSNGTIIGVVVVILLFGVIVAAYFYYQRIKPKFSNDYNLSFHFQNATYDTQNEVATSLQYVSGLPPGEHEYVNPMTDVLKVAENDNEKQIVKPSPVDQSDTESEYSGYKQNTRLI